MWGPPNTHEPLATIIPLFLTQYGAVSATDNRYLTIDGCVPSFCAASGLLWIDLGRPHPLAVFAAVNWDPQPTPPTSPRPTTTSGSSPTTNSPPTPSPSR